MELEPYDFGPVIPDACCDDADSTSGSLTDFAPVRLVYTVLAHADDPICLCKDRKFTVNLHKDDSWSFTYTNGDTLTSEDQATYCREIAAAQSYLEGQERWRRNGRNIGLWDPQRSFGATGTGARADDGTVYFPRGRSDDSFGDSGNCSVQFPINDI